MKYLDNHVARIHYRERGEVESSLKRLSDVLQFNPRLLEPFRGADNKAGDLFSAAGFQLFSTVRKTTLLYDDASGCFFKVLHPLSLKHRILFAITDCAGEVYKTSEYLFQKGVHIQRLEAYGVLKKGRKPVLVMKKAAGKSLYETLIVQGRSISMMESRAVLDQIVRLHSLGYWLRDSHLSHFFLQDGRVSGIIDIEGIRRNRPFALRHLAQDIAGMNHPRLPFSRDELRELLGYYLSAAGIAQEKKFKKHLKYYTKRRWQE